MMHDAYIFLVMALPLRLLWGLQINSRQKLALGGIFSLGIIIIIFAIVRVVEISATFNHVNPLWLALWSMIEASVGEHSVLKQAAPCCLHHQR